MNNILIALKIEYPRDIQLIREAVPFLSRYSDLEVEILWKAFSRSVAAGWLFVDDEWLEEFKKWLEN